jgi:hypothetical protein
MSITTTFRVGKRKCTMTLELPTQDNVTHVACEWHPTVPSRLTKKELAQYRSGRDAALAELGAILNGKIAVVEC